MKMMFQEYMKCNINILYTSSNKSFERGYLQLKKRHKHTHFTKENNFKEDLISQIDPDNKHTVFFVDDNVWKEHFSIDCDELNLLDEDPDLLCLSLRLDPELTYCYAYDTNMNSPEFDSSLRWLWHGAEGDFGYPMSLDGHIFRTNEILPLIEKLSYFNPNSLEGAMSINPLVKNKMICLRKAPIFNMPINKVQTHNNNRHGNISAEYLNKMFNAGYRISPIPLLGFDNNACHQEVGVTLDRSFLTMIKNIFNLSAY